jgi:hypothetical protein
MTAGCDLEALEALVADRLPTARAFEVQAHARACADCARELEWLRSERRWMNARKTAEPALPAGLWEAVEGRLVQPRGLARVWGRVRAARPLGRFAFPVLTGAAAVAAALLLLVRGAGEPTRMVQHLPPATNEIAGAAPARGEKPGAAGVIEVLDAALVEYEQAVAVLRQDLEKARGRLPAAQVAALEQGLGRAQRLVTDARAGRDPEARLRAVDGYADYVRSLQSALLTVEGASR